MSWKPLTAAIAATLIGSTTEAADIQHTYIRTADGVLHRVSSSPARS
jgi:hypothetical protein